MQADQSVRSHHDDDLLNAGLSDLFFERFLPNVLPEHVQRSLLAIAQQDVQKQLLKTDPLRARDLARFYRAVDPYFTHHEPFLDEIASRWEAHFGESPFRIVLSELPEAPGSSGAYRLQVLSALRRFRERFARLLTPVRVPLALEAVVKPPPLSRRSGLHDLDNVLRRYLIPGVVDVFRPPSHYTWAHDSLYSAPESRGRSRERGRATDRPLSTAVGLVRMEAWRIPRVEGDNSPGFVGLALVADEFGYDDTLREVDALADDQVERF
jgi:hypothetical protein